MYPKMGGDGEVVEHRENVAEMRHMTHIRSEDILIIPHIKNIYELILNFIRAQVA